ncbi:MAG: Ldh family oxidoreductase [Fischerella sp. CENA71]|nr:Ldh family oxidoreductase [Fischerella sp. CENA71]
MTAALQKRGMTHENIRYVVNGLIETSLRGNDSHGIRLFPIYLSELDGGRSRINANIRFESQSKAVTIIDADHALGLVVGMVAAKEVIQLCKSYGVGAVAVKNSNHFGAASYYTLEIARNDLIGISFSNSDALVTPFNGIEAFFGSNPLSLAAPAEKDELFCIDMATSQVSYSKVKYYWENGLLPETGWAIDDKGEDIAESNRKPVALLPMGGYKGQCLAMLVEVLCTLLTGTPLDHELTHLYSQPFHEARQVGHFFIALDIASFQNIAIFKQRLSKLMNLTRTQVSKPGTSIISPGDLERDTEKHRSVYGIPLSNWEFEQFQQIAEDVCLPLLVN